MKKNSAAHDAAVKKTLVYSANLTWDGNLGSGTSSYAAYGRNYRIAVPGKPELSGSADPAFRGEPHAHNPEEYFLSSVSACHMLFYLSLCASGAVSVLSYEDEASGTLALQPNGGGRFEEIVLRPRVTLAEGSDESLARRLHDIAHQRCFVANSCSFPIRLEASLETRQPRRLPLATGGRQDHGGDKMTDLSISLENRPGSLAEMGEALGRAGLSIEGGGAFVVDGSGIAHFLFRDGRAAREALESAGIHVIDQREVLVVRLNQAEPGQLGKIARLMAHAGVNIDTLYSDHDHQLILAVDDVDRGKAVVEEWRSRHGTKADAGS